MARLNPWFHILLKNKTKSYKSWRERKIIWLSKHVTKLSRVIYMVKSIKIKINIFNKKKSQLKLIRICLTLRNYNPQS